MVAQAVPQLNFRLPLVDAGGLATPRFQQWAVSIHARTGGSVDKVEAASATAAAAVPQTTQVVAGGGLQVGGALAGNVGLALYAAVTTVADLPATGMAEGDFAYALDGRKTGEGVGAGTGVPVWWSNGAWVAIDSGAAVAA